MGAGGGNRTRPRARTNNASIYHKTTATLGTNSRGKTQKIKSGRSPRVAPSEVPMETTEQRKPGRNTMITPSEVIMETQEKMKLGRSLRVVPSKITLLTQEEINHMVPTIKIATNNMATQIEDETLPWYFFNVVIYPDTGNILH